MVGVMAMTYDEYSEAGRQVRANWESQDALRAMKIQYPESLGGESAIQRDARLRTEVRAARLNAAQRVQQMTTIQIPEGDIMALSNVDQKIKQEMEKRRVEKEVARRLDLVDSYGVDNYDPGTVIVVEKEFTSTRGKPYTYAIIKAAEGDKWFSTGHDCVAGTTFTWDGLVEWLVTGEFPVTSILVKDAGGARVPAETPREEIK